MVYSGMLLLGIKMKDYRGAELTIKSEQYLRYNKRNEAGDRQTNCIGSCKVGTGG